MYHVLKKSQNNDMILMTSAHDRCPNQPSALNDTTSPQTVAFSQFRVSTSPAEILRSARTKTSPVEKRTPTAQFGSQECCKKE